MKKLIALMVGIAFAMGTAGFAVAQDKPTTMPEKKADTTAPKAVKKMAVKSASGTVKSAAAESIVVTGKAKGQQAEWTFGVDDKTKITKAGKSIMAADVKAGDAVTVKYMEMDGKAVAQSVTVKGEVAKKPATKSEEKK